MVRCGVRCGGKSKLYLSVSLIIHLLFININRSLIKSTLFKRTKFDTVLFTISLCIAHIQLEWRSALRNSLFISSSIGIAALTPFGANEIFPIDGLKVLVVVRKVEYGLYIILTYASEINYIFFIQER
jgi:hypothetical protein